MTSTPTSPPTGPSNLRLRVIYGAIGAVLLLGSVWFSLWSFGLFFAAVQAVMLWEFYRMMRVGGYAPARGLGLVAGTLLCLVTLAVALYATHEARTEYLPGTRGFPLNLVLLGWAVLLLALPTAALLRQMQTWPQRPQPVADAAVTVWGVLYVSLPLATLPLLADASTASTAAYAYDPRRIFGLLFLIWASDIGAYAVGRTLGKHKLAPSISPGKTWEGWAGGFMLTLAVGWALKFMLPDMPLAHRLVAASVVAVFAPLGDLAESMLKRSVGVKDSGSIMPGHGGLLDRFDAFLLVLPVLALLQLLAR